MNEHFANQIREGLDICDTEGNKIGSVSEVFQHSPTATAGLGGSSSFGTSPASTGYFKCTTGFLGLGTDYYIPFDAVTDIRDDCIFLNLHKDALRSRGWDQKPALLDNR